MIRHHIDDATVVSYAAGTLTPGAAVVIAAHLEMCSECRNHVAEAESIGGSLLYETQEVNLSPGAVNDLLEMLDVSLRKEPADRMNKARAVYDQDRVLPRCVSQIINMPLEDISWRRLGYGVSLFRIETGEDDLGKLYLMKIESGRKMPEHGHSGNELTLVLSGSYHDKLGTFGRGDMADLDGETEHQPVVSDDEDCICLVAIDSPTNFKGLIPRLMQPLIGI